MRKVLVLVVAGFLSFVLYSGTQRRDVVDQLEVYGSSAAPDAPLVADFTACLRQRSFLLPLIATECGTVVASKHGPDAEYRVDAVYSNLQRK